MPYSKVTGPKSRPNRGANVTGPMSRPARLKPSEMNSGGSVSVARQMRNAAKAGRVMTGKFSSD